MLLFELAAYHNGSLGPRRDNAGQDIVEKGHTPFRFVELGLLTVRLLLATIFVFAGITKLVDRSGSSKALAGFGLSAKFAGTVSLLLSATELAVGVALIPVALAWYGACGVIVLLSVFIVGISLALARGRRPDCHCFGQFHSAPVGWRTLLRAGLLAVPAAWLVFRGRLGVGPSLSAQIAAADDTERRIYIIAACAVCFSFFRALRSEKPAESAKIEPARPSQDGHQPSPPKSLSGKFSAPDPKTESEGPTPERILPTGVGLPVGSPAPDFELPDLVGQNRSLGSLREEGKPIVLIFSSPYCEVCQALRPGIAFWLQEHREALNIIIINRGSVQENLEKLKGFEIEFSRVLLQKEFEIAEAYDCTVTPAAVLVSTDGLIESDLATGGLAIRRMMSDTGAIFKKKRDQGAKSIGQESLADSK